MGERIRKSNSWELPWIIWSAVLAASGLMTGLLVNHGSGQGLLDHLLECVDDIFLLYYFLHRYVRLQNNTTKEDFRTINVHNVLTPAKDGPAAIRHRLCGSSAI